MSPETTQVGCVLPAQDIRDVNAGIHHDCIRRILRSAKTTDLRSILPKERKAPRAVPVQRDIKEANGVLPVHEAKGVEIGPRKQIIGWYLFPAYCRKKSVLTRQQLSTADPIQRTTSGEIGFQCINDFQSIISFFISFS